MATPILIPIEPTEFYSRLRQIIDTAIADKLNIRHLSPPPNGLNSKPLLSLKEVCELFHITKPTIYEWKERDILKPYKVRGKVYFLMSDIQLLIEASAEKSLIHKIKV